MNESKPVIIVGAGMAGLSCAVHLSEAGVPVRVFEASDGVGGRVRTDEVDGFLLDRGFQVYLDAYPETGRLLDLDALDLKPFEPGALVYRDGKLHRLMDVFRRPGSALSSLRAPVGTFADKLRVGLLRTRILSRSLKAIGLREDQSTDRYLKEFGFTDAIIDRFFRSFYGGIFLERELRTSSRMFEFTFKMFGKGSATLPTKGMGEIPKQLAARLPEGCVSLGIPVSKVSSDGVTLQTGERIAGSAVVVATNVTHACGLLPELKANEPEWHSVTNLYFAAVESPVNKSIICLNGEGKGLVNNVCVLSDTAPAYAPTGQSLISVSILGLQDEEDLPDRVREELSSWFGETVAQWRHLRTDRIRHALPEQLPGAASQTHGFVKAGDVWVCGDHAMSASIEGAVISGKRVAEAILSEGLEVRATEVPPFLRMARWRRYQRLPGTLWSVRKSAPRRSISKSAKLRSLERMSLTRSASSVLRQRTQ